MTNVLLVYDKMIPSVLLCGHNHLKKLDEEGKLSYRSRSRVRLTSKLCGWADVIFFIRADSRIEEKLAKMWKNAGKYLVYVLDDDLLNIPQTVLSAKHFHDDETQQCIKNIMALSDCLLSPSAKLRDIYGAGFSKVCPVEEPALQSFIGQRRLQDSNPIKIGFAGSDDRGYDIDILLSDTVRALISRFGEKIKVEFFGASPQIAKQLGLTCYPYCSDYETYQKKMLDLNWDIGLAPMPDTAFHACKHYNKFIEYSGVGIAAVYSDLPPYQAVVTNGVTGLLCVNTTQAWTDAITYLIENTEKRKYISEQCQRMAKNNFSLETVSEALFFRLADVFKIETNRNPLHEVKRIYLVEKPRRILKFIRRHGLMTPMAVIKRLAQKNK